MFYRKLWGYKAQLALEKAICEKLSKIKRCFHEHSAQVVPVKTGIPWLGFVVYPEYRRIKRRNVINAKRRLSHRYKQYQKGDISFAEFDANTPAT